MDGTGVCGGTERGDAGGARMSFVVLWLGVVAQVVQLGAAWEAPRFSELEAAMAFAFSMSRPLRMVLECASMLSAVAWRFSMPFETGVAVRARWSSGAAVE